MVKKDETFILSGFGYNVDKKIPKKWKVYSPDLYGVLPDGTRIFPYNEFTTDENVLHCFYTAWYYDYDYTKPDYSDAESVPVFWLKTKYEKLFYQTNPDTLEEYFKNLILTEAVRKSHTGDFDDSNNIKEQWNAGYNLFSYIECHKLMHLSSTNHFGFTRDGEKLLLNKSKKRYDIYRTCLILANFQFRIQKCLIKLGFEDDVVKNRLITHKLFPRFSTPFQNVCSLLLNHDGKNNKISDDEMHEFYKHDTESTSDLAYTFQIREALGKVKELDLETQKILLEPVDTSVVEQNKYNEDIKQLIQFVIQLDDRYARDIPEAYAKNKINITSQKINDILFKYLIKQEPIPVDELSDIRKEVEILRVSYEEVLESTSPTIEELNEKNNYSPLDKAKPFPISQWKGVEIQLKNKFSEKNDGYQLFIKANKKKNFVEVDMVKFGFRLKNGKLSKTFKTFEKIANSETGSFNLTLRDKIGFENLKKDIQRLNEKFVDFFKFKGHGKYKNPFFYSSLENGYISCIHIHKTEWQDTESLEERKLKQGATELSKNYDLALEKDDIRNYNESIHRPFDSFQNNEPITLDADSDNF